LAPEPETLADMSD